jgi:hypothetical protein
MKLGEADAGESSTTSARECAIAGRGSRESSIRGLAWPGESCQVLDLPRQLTATRDEPIAATPAMSSATKTFRPRRHGACKRSEQAPRRRYAVATETLRASFSAAVRAPPRSARGLLGGERYTRLPFARKPRAELRRARWRSWVLWVRRGRSALVPALARSRSGCDRRAGPSE